MATDCGDKKELLIEGEAGKDQRESFQAEESRQPCQEKTAREFMGSTRSRTVGEGGGGQLCPETG